MAEARFNMRKTKDIDNPHYYVTALKSEYGEFSFDEDEGESLRGQWRSAAFKVDENAALDLEIGTGNGYFFAHRANLFPNRCLVGIELKFKPIVQTIRRAVRAGSKNARVVRYHARGINNLFAPKELNHIFIHHPDPWTKLKKHKHRLVNVDFLNHLSLLQRPGSFLELKTDSQDYFMWMKEAMKQTSYKLDRYTEDLHNSELSGENFTTQFERIFIQKGQPIYYLRALQVGAT